METSNYFWVMLLFGYALSLAAEYKIHVGNVRYLVHHGATVRGSRLLNWFYRAHLFIVLAAIVEHVGFSETYKTHSLIGLGLLFLGFFARHWGILRKGRLWTRHFVLFRSKLVVKDSAGPGWVQRLDIIGRIIEVFGFCVVLQSWQSLTASVVLLPVWCYYVIKEESELCKADIVDF
jgi:isoprenylcysteine carboxyl methyltransferase (ICMT) family protein YpbQ